MWNIILKSIYSFQKTSNGIHNDNMSKGVNAINIVHQMKKDYM
jgi:hypothetical protein